MKPLLVVFLLTTLGTAAYGAPRAIPTTPRQFFGQAAHAKMVRFSVRNDSAAPVEVRAEDRVYSVAPKETLALKVAEGTNLFANEAFGPYAKGDVLFHITRSHNGDTLAVR